MKKFLLVTTIVVLASAAFGQYEPRVFDVAADFFTPTHDTRLAEIGQRTAWLPTNLPRKVQGSNQWWTEGDFYIPSGWPIPNRDLGLGLWFGWYLHRSDRSLNRSAVEQIQALPVPEPVKKIFLQQKISAGIRTSLLRSGTLVNSMTFVSKGELVAPQNCIWLGKEDLNVHLYPQISFEGWIYQLGFVFDCNNHFIFKWKLQETETQKVEKTVAMSALAARQPVTRSIVAPTYSKKILIESAVWGGHVGLAMKNQTGVKMSSNLLLIGQESSVTFAEDRTTFLWLNSICEYWQENQLNEGLSPNWSKNTGFQWFAGPQARFYHGNGGVLKLGVTAGQRYAYDLVWNFLLRPRLNWEKYSIIGKFGFQTEADAVFSVNGPQEELYFGNAGVFYAPSFGRKLWLGIEYTNVKAANGSYASSGTFAMAKWEGVFNLNWLTLIGKYRWEQANVYQQNHYDPSKVFLQDTFDGVRWGLFAAITLKR